MNNELEMLFSMISERIDNLKDDISYKIDRINEKISRLENSVNLINIERIRIKQTWKTITVICAGASSLSGVIGYAISKILPLAMN